MIPFTSEKASWEDCHYVPTRIWGLSVIIIYNIIPFCIMAVNYAIIWRVAAKFAFSDRDRENSLLLSLSRRITKSNAPVLPKLNPTSSKLKFALEMKATKTSLSLIAVYIICWGPLGVLYMIDHFCFNCLSRQASLGKTRMSIKMLCFTSSLIAPIIYCWINYGYRKAAKRVFTKFGLSETLVKNHTHAAAESEMLRKV